MKEGRWEERVTRDVETRFRAKVCATVEVLTDRCYK